LPFGLSHAIAPLHPQRRETLVLTRTVTTILDLIWSHPANRGRRLRAIASSAGWQLYKRTIRRPIDVRAFGLKFRCQPDSGDASRMIYVNRLPDPDEMLFLQRYLRPGDWAIDAGANVGIYTLLMASAVGPRGRVLAFEPADKAFAFLTMNVEMNDLGQVALRKAAIADFCGTADFNQGEDEANALSSLRESPLGRHPVDVVTLDSEIADGGYAVCKIDVEGAEFAALKGAEHSLRRLNPPVLLLELTNRTLKRSGSSVDELRDWLKERGYELWTYLSEGNLLEPWVERPRKPGHVGDAIAIAESALGEVRSRLGSASL
jgi:FkbM family methyltransferase